MSLGDFMGGQPATDMSALPTRPKERGPDDDGSFKRRSDYNDRDQEPSRSDGDNNWRRGGGGGGSTGGSLRGGGGGYDDRRGGGGYNNRGGGGFDRFDNERDRDDGGFDRRGGYNDNRNGFDNSDRRGSNRAGYDNHSDRGGSGFDSFRRGSDDRGAAVGDSRNASSSQTGGSIGSGMRPRLQLKTRTTPEPSKSAGERETTIVDERRTEDKIGVKHNEVGTQNFVSSQTGGSIGRGMRPRLQLKTRTAPEPSKSEGKKESTAVNEQRTGGKISAETNDLVTEDLSLSKKEEMTHVDNTTPSSGEDGWETVEGVKNKSSKENQITESAEEIDVKEEEEKKPSKKREPVIVNSRAAMLESAPAVKRDSSNANANRKDNERSRGPPPVVNKRFEQLADEERGKQQDRESRRGPPQVTNSRFAAAAEADKDMRQDRDEFKNIQDPPTVTNSRFAAAAEADRSYSNNRSDLYDNRDRGPPPIANSRFAAAAEADRDRSYNRNDADRGPPPVANSRFAAAAEADRDRTYNREKNNERMDDRDRGPPPIANSRFAAAAEADRDYSRGHDDFDGGRGDRGPPLQANSRFAAAAEADRDRGYNRDGHSGMMDRDRGPPPVANSRFAAAAEADRDYNRDRDDCNGGRGDRQNNRDYYDDRRGYDGGRGDRFDESPRYQHQEKQPHKSSVADLLKPKARPMEDNILKVPSKQQSANFLSPPSKERDENIVGPSSKAKPVTESKPVKSAPPGVVDHSAVLAEFVSGNTLGSDLKIWLQAQAVVPSVEKLVFHLLTETEKSSPDLECAWAEPNKYGTVLLSLVEDDLIKQMEVLFAIQKYCDRIGMPKLNDEYVVQAMFRSMYKYDLADDETFSLWKEDESPEHETGKLKAVIQTIDWFNWLEEDEEEDYEE